MYYIARPMSEKGGVGQAGWGMWQGRGGENRREKKKKHYLSILRCAWKLLSEDITSLTPLSLD